MYIQSKRESKQKALDEERAMKIDGTETNLSITKDEQQSEPIKAYGLMGFENAAFEIEKYKL